MFKRLIKAIEFSISSDQDVLNQSMVEVLHGKIPRGQQEELCNTLYNLRMGTIEKGVKCETCSMNYTKCKGHFGHIALAVPVVNPICLKQLKWIVKHICKKYKRIVITKQHLSLNSIKNYKQSSKYIDKVASCFHCSAPRTSDDMFDVDNIEGTDLEEVSKILTNMCQEDTDVLNIQECHPKSCIMHYFPIIPTCARPFLTKKDESFDDDLTCQLSEIVKANNLVKKFLSSGMKPNAKDLQCLVFCINTYYDNRRKKSRHSTSGHAYEGISDILMRKDRHIRKHLCGKRANQGAKTVLGGDASLRINQVGIPKDICKVLTKSMVVNSVNYDLAEKLIREKKVNYVQKGGKNFFEISQARD